MFIEINEKEIKICGKIGDISNLPLLGLHAE
jgi:hypothetical protein